MIRTELEALLTLIAGAVLGMAQVTTAAAQNAVDNVTVAQAAPAVAREPLDAAWWTGPIFASSAATLPQGHVLIEPYLFDQISHAQFDDNWSKAAASRTDGFRSLTYLLYGVTDTFMAGLIPRFGYNVIDHVQQSGPQAGDTTLRLQYQLASFHDGGSIPTLSLVFEETFPTGKYDGLNSHAGSGLGAGAYTTTASLYSQYYFWLWSDRILRARLNLSYSLADQSVKLHDASVYGTSQGFRGHARPGSGFESDLAFEYSLTRHWVPAIDIIYEYAGSTVVSGVVSGAAGGPGDPGVIAAGLYKRSAGSESIVVAPAMEYNWNGHVGMILGAAATVAGRNTAATVIPVVAINLVF